MSKSIYITQLGYNMLKERQKEILKVLKKPGRKPKSLSNAFNAYKSQLSEIESILQNSVVTEKDEKQPAIVQLGSKVAIENLTNGIVLEYTIMSRATADPTKGIISNESPIAEKIQGLKVGNTFKFKSATGSEDSYKIIRID